MSNTTIVSTVAACAPCQTTGRAEWLGKAWVFAVRSRGLGVCPASVPAISASNCSLRAVLAETKNHTKTDQGTRMQAIEVMKFKNRGIQPVKRLPFITSVRILAAAALFCGLILTFIDTKFTIMRPFPDDYDETNYINEACADRSILVKQGLVEFARHFVLSASIRPPGYRLAGFFAGLVSEPGPAVLRSLSLLSLFVTGLLLFLSGKEISGTDAGIVWASAFAFSMGAVSAALNFGTETTFLYPALAGSLYSVARWFHKVRPDAVTLGALALSAALGSLSKLTFFPVFVPLIGAAMLLAPETDQRRRSLLAISRCYSRWYAGNYPMVAGQLEGCALVC
jgi:Dolichyl-phosphate-mannose-protein mannosyltransferase